VTYIPDWRTFTLMDDHGRVCGFDTHTTWYVQLMREYKDTGTIVGWSFTGDEVPVDSLHVDYAGLYEPEILIEFDDKLTDGVMLLEPDWRMCVRDYGGAELELPPSMSKEEAVDTVRRVYQEMKGELKKEWEENERIKRDGLEDEPRDEAITTFWKRLAEELYR